MARKATSRPRRRTYIARFDFSVTRGPVVFESVLGLAGDSFVRDGHLITIRMPPPGSVRTVTSIMIKDIPSTVELSKFNVDIEIKLDPKGFDVNGALEDRLALAQAVAEEFMGWVRHEADQPWVQESHEAPSMLEEPELIEKQTGKSLGGALHKHVAAAVTHPWEADTGEALDRAVARVASGGPPPTAEELLMDARQTMAPKPINSNLRNYRWDTRRAVLLAAIAAEMKIAMTLRTKSSDPARADELIDEESVAKLPHKPTRELLGRSLHEEDPRLYRRLGSRDRRALGLYPLRNRVAHKGVAPTYAEAVKAVGTARLLFRWLDDL